MFIREESFQRYLTALRVVFSVVILTACASFVYKSIHWQVTWDATAMHYINFLMEHGWAPYRDIIDNNLPGSYLVEGWAMHVFGSGDLGWRMYDFFLVGVLTVSMVVIALPYDWFIGVYAGGFFMLLHGLEGARNAGQREQVMVTFIMVAYALMFTAVRRRLPLLMLPFGFLSAFAASFKPTVAPLGLVLLLLLALTLRKKGIAAKPYLIYGTLGMFVAFLATVAFFYKYHAFGDFIDTSRRLLPYYASSGNTPFFKLLGILLIRVRGVTAVLPAIGLLLLLLVNRSQDEWENWERAALGIGILFGAFSYLAQRKVFEHHAYTFEVIVLLWSGLELAKAMKRRGWPHAVAVACLGVVVLGMVPVAAYRIEAEDEHAAQPDALKDDLIRLGGPKLQRQVQCLDLVDGCYGTLSRLGLIQNTGFMGDYMFFGPQKSVPLPYYRTLFWNDLHKNPPKVIVLTNMWLVEGFSFDKLKQWPEMAAYLDSAYTLDVARDFGYSGYRIYLLRDTPGQNDGAKNP